MNDGIGRPLIVCLVVFPPPSLFVFLFQNRCRRLGPRIDQKPHVAHVVIGMEFIGFVSGRLSCVVRDVGVAQQYFDLVGFSQQPPHRRRGHLDRQCVEHQPQRQHVGFKMELVG
jgi:hypothetical protein